MKYYLTNDRGEITYSGDQAPSDPRYFQAEEPSVPFPVWDGAKWITDEAKVAARTREGKLVSLGDSDAGIVRALEDLIAVLITKGTITEADLPKVVRDKIAARAALRETL